MLPEAHSRWMQHLVAGPLPEETAATCDHCVMCRPEGASGRAEVAYFDSTSKCCTYLPQLANFTLGAILADDSPEFAAGRASIEQRLEAGDGVTPLGLSRPWAYDLLYRETMKAPEAFGRTPSLRCPHYIAGGCSIWKYREPTCSTWFCRHVRGAVGRDFWSEVKTVLKLVDQALARHAVLAVGLGGDALARLFEPEAKPSPAMWGDWLGRERAFFGATAAVAANVAWPELRELGGVELEVHLRLLDDAYARVTADDVPRRLRRRELHVLPSANDHCRVTTYRIYDPIELPTALVDALHRFDGRPTAEVVAELRREDGVVLDHDTLRQLVDFEIVAPETR